MKVKIFTVTQPKETEEIINAWLQEHPAIELQHVCQCESMNKESWSLTTTLFYTEPGSRIGFEGPE